ncbi:DUF2254 domain-containing protein [Erythrobacter arachoides]|uniref:DUF2254 domain-containing protein n=2 Tax=Aurantiacibacter arachoides TaxID=1850444 RepID=A0A844ZZG1_9SPHN|nr:DUF2254 family protein [Aurantiacibacter arachoides]MXO92316.1 DUF2254 domain-containing protein [Aurantiacibacter arachoides]GGD58122.1 hypothetical protein GCM10011411_17750 [Aurantiacibacter arachoides]
MANTKTITAPRLGRLDWWWHRVVASYWSLPLLGVLAAAPALIALLAVDRAGLSEWMLDEGFDPVATADTAKDLVAVAVGVNAAFITLYFSLTLLVLTVASSNLGVRLVDRWLDKRLVRVSLSGLSFTLIFSLCALAAIDAEADKDDLPVAVVAAVLFLQAVNVTMLTVALHDLGRTIFVDRSIHALGRDASAGPVSVVPGACETRDWAMRVSAPKEGYVEGNDLTLLRKWLGDGAGRVRICAPPGQHVLAGETLMQIENDVSARIAEAKLCHAMPVGDFRSDGQGAVFRIRLLVEIAARALSPAINDFYTALTCADRLGAAILAHRDNWVDDDCMPLFVDDRDFELPGQDFRGLFEDPLNAFRQAACQYPSVSIRMIDNYARISTIVCAKGQSGQFADFLRDLARQLSDHAAATATYDGDRHDIREAFARGFAHREG